MSKVKYMSFSSNFEQIEDDVNSDFLKTKIKLFAFGKNRNGSEITKSAFEKAKDRGSYKNIPVVAKFSDDSDIYGKDGDLEGHNPYLEKDKDGKLVYKMDTFPIGVVSSDSNITYEEVNEGTEEVPDYKTYVVIDNVYLWKRYEATQKIQEWLDEGIEPKISMEIGNIDGKFNKETYVINDFKFEAIAAIGSKLTPCFPMSQIEQYSNQTFENSFYEMLGELKNSLEKGGNDLSKTNLKFSLTSEQLEDELSRELSEIEIITDEYWEDYTYPRYSFVDSVSDSMEVIAWDCKESCLVGAKYSVQADNVEIDALTIKRYKVNGYIPMDLSSDSDEVENETIEFHLVGSADVERMVTLKDKELNKKYEDMSSEFSLLKKFKDDALQGERQESEDELFSRFSLELNDEELDTLKSNASTLTLEQIETQLYALVGKKKGKFEMNKPKEKPLNLKVNFEEGKKGTAVWDDLMKITVN